MLAARSKHKFAIVALASFAALIILLSSQHRLRLIFGSYEVARDLHSVKGARYMVPLTAYARPPFSEALTILKIFDDAHPEHPGDALPAIDQPDTCERLL